MEKRIFIKGARTIGYSHKKKKVWPIPHAIHKNDSNVKPTTSRWKYNLWLGIGKFFCVTPRVYIIHE